MNPFQELFVYLPVVGEVPLTELIEPSIRIATAMAILGIAIVVYMLYNRFVDRLIAIGILDIGSGGAVKRITGIVILTFSVLLATYVLTGSSSILFMVLLVAGVALLSGLDVFSNLVSYYVITSTRLISRGQYIFLPNGPHGVVREIRPLYTIVENDQGSYAIPNTAFLKSGRLTLEVVSPVRLVVKVIGFQDMSEVDKVITLVKESVSESRDILISPSKGSNPEVVIDEISEDSIVLRITLSLPGPRPNLSKLTSLIQSMASQLKDLGYTYTIALELPEGYEQRWRVVA